MRKDFIIIERGFGIRFWPLDGQADENNEYHVSCEPKARWAAHSLEFVPTQPALVLVEAHLGKCKVLDQGLPEGQAYSCSLYHEHVHLDGLGRAQPFEFDRGSSNSAESVDDVILQERMCAWMTEGLDSQHVLQMMPPDYQSDSGKLLPEFR